MDERGFKSGQGATNQNGENWTQQQRLQDGGLSGAHIFSCIRCRRIPTICVVGVVKRWRRRECRVEVAMGLVSFPKVIVPSLLVSCVLSYAFWDLARNRKIFGGTVPHTIKSREWENESDKKMDAWPREAAGPVALNPISRQNYRKV